MVKIWDLFIYSEKSLCIRYWISSGFIATGIIQSRTEGKAKLYMFDEDSKIAMRLHEFARYIDMEHGKQQNKKKVYA